MLKEVIRPDQSSVCFQYDTFGRRVEKSIVGKQKEKAAEKKRETVTRFLWDGNSDPNIPTHAHAGKVPSGGNQYTYDFKKPENRYTAIKDARHGKDHHLKIGCKG